MNSNVIAPELTDKIVFFICFFLNYVIIYNNFLVCFANLLNTIRQTAVRESAFYLKGRDF